MLYKIEYLTFYFSIPVGGSFFRQVFKYEFSRLFERLIWAVSTIFILGLLLPLRIYSHFLLYFQLAFLITGLYVVYVIIRAMMHQKEGSLITLAGFIMMFLAFLNDMFNSQGIIHTVYIFQFGLVAFIFAQSYMLSKLFANTFRRAERLNLELVDSNTKLESAYNEIVAKERARTLFFHNTSHELRTPLNGIIGFTQLLASGRYGKLGQAAVAQVGKVQKLADSLKMQVNTILDLAKAKKGELSLELSRISLDEVAEECRILAQGLITDHAHNFFDIKVATEGQNFVNDKEKLLTILRNLIGNAFKFKKLDQENRVEVQLSLKGNNISPKDATQDDVEEKNLTKNLNKNQDDSIQVLTIRVSDTGIGIPKEHLGRIFEEFKQVDGAARRSFEGTGLGLAMVKKIVDLMGGKIKVESQLDQGTTFIITIPEQTQTKDGDVLIVEKSFADKTKPQKDIVSAGEQDHADIDLAAQKSEEAGTDKDLLAGSGTQEYGDSDTPSHNLASFYSEDNGQYTILVVDDIQINVEVISELLRAAGYNVEESFGGRDALDKIKNSPPDLLLLDLMMPDVSGEDVLQAVRKDERLKELPVILVTARASKEDKLLGLGMGADDYLAKPIISEELLLRVRGILTRLELAKAMQVLVSQQSMSQVGYVMEDLARELKDLHTAVLNGFTASKEPLTNQLQSFSPLQPFFQSFLRGLFNPNTVSTKEKRQRMASHHLSVGLSPNQKKDLQIINALISELEMDEDFQLQLWESLKSLEEESLTSLRDTLETIRSFAVMQEGARISKEMLQSVLQHIHNSLKGQAPGLRQSYILVLRLLESRLTRSQIAVEMEIGEELGQGVDLYQVPQMLFNLIQVAQSILADGDLSKKRINITASQENGCLVNHITLPGLLLTEDEIRELDHGGDEGQSKPGLYLSHRLIQKRSGYLTINCVNGSTLFELGIKG